MVDKITISRLRKCIISLPSSYLKLIRYRLQSTEIFFMVIRSFLFLRDLKQRMKPIFCDQIATVPFVI